MSTAAGKVLHLIDTGGPGGAETMFLHLARGLSPELGAALLVVGREGWLADRARALGLQAIALDPRGSFNVGYLRALQRLIERERVRLVVAHLFGAILYGGMAARLRGVPLIGVLHGQSDIGGSGLATILKSRIAARCVSRMVFVSEPLRGELNTRLRLPLARTAVITNGIDTAQFTPGHDQQLKSGLRLAPGTTLLCAVGNVRVPKDYATLLQALKQLIDAGAKVHLAIAGEGHGALWEELHALRDTLGLGNHASFLGLQTDIVGILRGSDLFVSSSRTEGFSIVCIEAMACARAVVATRSGGPESIVDHERTGLLVPVADPAALAAAIGRLVAEPGLRAKYGAAGCSKVAAQYALSTTIAHYEALARTLIRPL